MEIRDTNFMTLKREKHSAAVLLFATRCGLASWRAVRKGSIPDFLTIDQHERKLLLIHQDFVKSTDTKRYCPCILPRTKSSGGHLGLLSEAVRRALEGRCDIYSLKRVSSS